MDPNGETFVTHSLSSEGADASEDGTGRGTPIVPFTISSAESCEVQSHARETKTARCLDQTGGFANGQGGTVIGFNIIGLAQDGKNHAYQADKTGVIQHKGNSASGNEAGTVIVFDQSEGGQQCATNGNLATNDASVGIETSSTDSSTETSQKSNTTATPATSPGGSQEPQAYQCHGSNVGPMGTIRAGNGNETGGVPFVAQESEPQSFQTRIARNGRGQPKGIVDALTSNEGGAHADSKPHVFGGGMMVRRLMPVECCRLQGFPDDWLDLEPPLSDSAKYRLLGNAVAVPVALWIGKRIAAALEANR
jgi:DNA (cytosine-5)-methyltransferase 1